MNELEEAKWMASVWEENARLNSIREEIRVNNEIATACWKSRGITVDPRVKAFRELGTASEQ